MPGEPVHVRTGEGTAVITISREPAMNALDEGARDALREAFAAAGADESIGAVVLTGAGEKAFCAGQDIKEAVSFDAERGARWAGELERLYRAVRSFEKPVVCAVNGIAAGLGFQLALLADIRIAADTARMGQTEINVGLPGVTGPWIMREIIGLAATIEMTLSGRLVDARECYTLGLVNDVVPAAQLEQAARRRAEDLASKPRLAVALSKRRIWQMIEPGFREAMAAAERHHRAAFASGEPQRVMRDFLERRSTRG